MAEYILRDTALLAIMQHGCDVGTLETIMQLPAKDVAPVMHGRWVELTNCASPGAYCSVCSKRVYAGDYARCNKRNKIRSNFCPNCGAKMMAGGTDDD